MRELDRIEEDFEKKVITISRNDLAEASAYALKKMTDEAGEKPSAKLIVAVMIFSSKLMTELFEKEEASA